VTALDYPRDTLGYHRQMAVAVFGEESPAVVWLDAKAAESPKGLNEGVVADEGQVVYLLTKLHFAGQEQE
jgi:hypothetical protein